jgi:hypothetical protein
MIDLTAAVCEHCNKEVPSHRTSGPEPAAQAQPGQTLAPDPAVEASTATTAAASLVDLSTATGQLMWWGTGILIYGVLLFGFALGYPAPQGSFALLLVVAQLAVAFFLNRFLWTRMKSWPMPKVTRTMIVLAGAVVVLVALGWARRRFLS